MPLHKLRRSGSGNVFSLDYLGTQAAVVSAPSYTLSGATLGDANGNRVIIVAVMNNVNVAEITGVTVGGVTATNLISAASAGTRATLWAAVVPTGTTGDIVLSAGTNANVRFGWFRMIRAGASITPTNSGSTTVASGTISLACTVPDGGAAVVLIADDDVNATHTATNYTENFDGADGGSTDSATGGIFTATATLSCENTTINTEDKAMVYASWGA